MEEGSMEELTMKEREVRAKKNLITKIKICRG
jgi:hypothetical protein